MVGVEDSIRQDLPINNNMSNYQKLDDFLSQQFSPDYWSDDAMHYATSLIQLLNDGEWDALTINWKSKVVDWQIKLAEAVYGCEDHRVIDLLLQLLNAPDLPVAVAASESLEAKDYVWKPGEAQREVLLRLHNELDGYEQETIKKLLTSID